MKERGWFCFHNADGKIMLSVEKGEPGVLLEAVIPEAYRGDGFADFPFDDYLHLAKLVLVTPDDWVDYSNTLNALIDASGIDQEFPPCPGIDPDYLKLKDKDGRLDEARFAELMKIVEACWWQTPSTAVQPGIVAQLWRTGMSVENILNYLQTYVTSDYKFDFDRLRQDQEAIDILNEEHQVMRNLAPLPINYPIQTRLGSAPKAPRKIGRNAPCPCGSGKKFKKCCG